MPYKDVKAWRAKTKQLLVNCLGGKCNKCGYDRCLSAMDFHHIDPSQKEGTLSDYLTRPTATLDIIKEIRKCVVLCKVCHCELHAGMWSLSEIDLPAFDESHIPWRFGPKQAVCPTCSRVFTTKESTTKFCCVECARQARTTRLARIEGPGQRPRKVERPSKAELEVMVWNTPTSTIARQFKVSDQAVAKWCKAYGIKKPGPGHWMKFGAKV